MRSLLLLIAFVVVGSVPVVDAQIRRTDPRYDERTYGPYDRPGWSRPGWDRPGHRSYALTGVVDTRRSRNLIHVHNQPLDRLTIQATDGDIFVRRISVECANHNVVDYELNVRLRAGDTRTIDLRGRRVYRMEVIADPRWRGSYQVLGTPSWRRPGPPVG